MNREYVGEAPLSCFGALRALAPRAQNALALSPHGLANRLANAKHWLTLVTHKTLAALRISFLLPLPRWHFPTARHRVKNGQTGVLSKKRYRGVSKHSAGVGGKK